MAALSNQGIWTSTNLQNATGVAGFLSGSQYDAITLQYIGDRLFVPLTYQSYSGSFVMH